MDAQQETRSTEERCSTEALEHGRKTSLQRLLQAGPPHVGVPSPTETMEDAMEDNTPAVASGQRPGAVFGAGSGEAPCGHESGTSADSATHSTGGMSAMFVPQADTKQ